MGSAIKILFFLIFFGVWIVKIAKKFSEMKNTQSQTAYSPQRKEEIPQPAEEFPELDFEKEQETHQASKEPIYETDQDAVRGLQVFTPEEQFEQVPKEEYAQSKLVEDEVEEIPEEKVPEATSANYSWKSEESLSLFSLDISDARTGIIMSEILGKPIALR